MKRYHTLLSPKNTFIFLLLFVSVSSFAQVEWTGAGDGTSWEDAANWENGIVPPSDSLIDFTQDATITGTAAATHPKVSVSGGAIVTFDLDLSIGDGTTDEHALSIGANSTLNLATGRTFTINPPSNKQGVTIFNSSEAGVLNVAEGATLNIEQGVNGINLVNPNASITIDGIVNFGSEVKNGIKSSASFIVNGTLNLNDLITDGIQVKAGVFENNGEITITKPEDDCIEVIDGGTFMNAGMLNLVAQDSAGSGNNAIAIGTDMVEGFFVNTSTGIIEANGGIKTSGRAISNNEMGTLTNSGRITLSGGGETVRYYNRGTTTNDLNAILDLTDGRMNLNQGTITNNGLLKSTREGSGVFSSAGAVAINNAFFDYNMGSLFAAGMGDVTNNGINLNAIGNRTINGGGTCDLDIAEATYEYFEGANSIGTTDATGALTLGNEVLSADSVIVTTTIEGVELIVKNVCAEAVMTSSVFDTDLETKNLKVYPSVIGNDQMLTVDLSDLPVGNYQMSFYNLNGQLEHHQEVYGSEAITLTTDHFNKGLHLIKIQTAKMILVGRFIVL